MPKARVNATLPIAPVKRSPRRKRNVELPPEEEVILHIAETTDQGDNDDAVVSADKGSVVDEAAEPPSTSKSGTAKRKRTKPDPTTKQKKSRTADVKVKAVEDIVVEQSEEAAIQEEAEIDSAQQKPKKTTKKRKIKDEEIKVPEEDDEIDGAREKPKKIVKKRKTKEEKEAEAMPVAARTTGLRMFVGAHVSITKGLENAVTNCLHIGGNAFALFLKNQRRWEQPPLKDENRDAFRKHCEEHKYDSMSHILPHGSYLVNLATPDKEKAKQSYDTFVDDLHRCEALGIRYYNFHPGTTNQEPLPEAIGRLAANLNRALSETKTVVPLLENMAGGGSVIGSRFTDLRDIIALIKPEFKSRIGICLDTCHAFAAGYDLRTPASYKKTMDELNATVGLQYLKALHINDSKAPFSSKRDLHQNIGLGFLGLRAFHNIMNDSRLENKPLVLETPDETPDPVDPTSKHKPYAREIKMLESLIGMDAESQDFKDLEARLSEAGRTEREKMSAAIEAREEKANKKLERARAKDQRSLKEMLGGKSVKAKGKGTATGKRKGSVSSVSSGSELSEAVSVSDA